jgi:hypothetical protein
MIDMIKYTEFKKADYDNLFSQIGQKYNITHYEVKDIFINTLSQVFNNKIICCVNDHKYVFKKIGLKENKIISFSIRIQNTLNENFILNLEQYCKKIRFDSLKDMMKVNRIIKVKVIKKELDCILVYHSLLSNCILPHKLIPKNELQYFTIDSEHYLFLHSYNKSKNEIILSATNKYLDLYRVQKILKNSDVYKVNRYYGVRMKVYLKHHPKKIEFETLKLSFKNEKIKYIVKYI